MKIGAIFLILLFVFCSVAGCQEQESVQIETGNEIIDEMIQDIRQYRIDIDLMKVDTLQITHENKLGKDGFGRSTVPDYFGRVAGLNYFKDHIFVADSQQGKIWEMDHSGTWIHAFGGEGEGPGEFRMLIKLMSNLDHLFAIDRSNARVQIYDEQMNLIDMFNQTIYGISDEQITVSDEHLFFPSNPFSDSLLVNVHNVTPPYQRVHAFLPALIPPGYQPAAYNTYHAHSNRKGSFVVTYAGTPFLMVYDPDLSLNQIIKFKSSYYDKLNNPELTAISMNELRESGNLSVPGVKSFIYNLVIDENDDIYFTIEHQIYRFVKSNSGREYLPDRGWVIISDQESIDEKEYRVISPSKILVNGKDLVVSSFGDNEIFKFQID